VLEKAQRKTGEGTRATPGFGTMLAALVIIVSFIIFRKSIKRGKNNEM